MLAWAVAATPLSSSAEAQRRLGPPELLIGSEAGRCLNWGRLHPTGNHVQPPVSIR